MNERIQELASKAGAEVKIIHGDILYISKADLDIEKFAKLIVRECAHLVGGYTKENEFGTDVKEAYEEITKHFGVEQ